MIYYFTGLPLSGKTTLGKKLHNFLKTEKRNWRQSVFHIDDVDLLEITKDPDYAERGSIKSVRDIQIITEYLHNNNCDVVVTMVSPQRSLREDFKDKFADGDYQEIFLYNNDIQDSNFHITEYERPEINFIDIDTTKDSTDKSFSKLINTLNKLGKL